MSVPSARGAALLVGIVSAGTAACVGPKAAAAPETAALLPAPVAATAAPAVPAASPARPFEQPKSCPPPLTWEDGTPIELSVLCPDQPRFSLHQGACCRYRNDCVAPDKVPGYAELGQCETARLAAEERAKRPPRCEPGQLAWQPAFCAFASCVEGELVTPRQQYADCRRPLSLELSFEPNRTTLSTNQIGQLENAAAMADVLGVQELRVEGQQSYDETPGEKSPKPLSLQRAHAVRDALARATRIPIAVRDGGTTSRLRGSPELFRTVSVTLAPLGDGAEARTTPFTLPWKPCESRVKFQSEIAVTKHDGQVLVEVCRDEACSRGVIDAAYHATWPGGASAAMSGDLVAWHSLKETPQQLIRNGFNALANGGVLEELDGEKPASFAFSLSFTDPGISEGSTYHLRLLRRRTEPALEWSGKLTFRRTLRHPTRDPSPCLEAELEIPRSQHTLR